jgi:hypothetical protein
MPAHPTAALPVTPTVVMPASHRRPARAPYRLHAPHPTATLPVIPTVVMPAQAGIQYPTGTRRRNANAGVYWITRLRG